MMIGDSFAQDLARFRTVGPRGQFRFALHCLRTPGVHAVAAYRFGSWARGLPAWARLVADPAYWVFAFLVHVVWGIEISRHARIAPGLYIGHSGGIVVSSRAVLGARCSLSQGVTIGVNGSPDNPGAPELGDDVYVGAGAKIFGPVRIGNNVKIGANAVVHRDIPDNAVVALDPGFTILSFRGNRRSESAA
jgi:serine O-acetyltransferase